MADIPMVMRTGFTFERPVSTRGREGRGLGGDVCKTLFHYPIKVPEHIASKFHFLFGRKLGEFFSDLRQNQAKAEQSRLLVLEVAGVPFGLRSCVSSGRPGY